MSWDTEKIQKLKDLWGKGNNTASQIAEIIGDVSRNAVIGKAHRLNLSKKMVPGTSNKISKNSHDRSDDKNKVRKRGKFNSLIIEKDFPPESPKDLESLSDSVCRWPIGHPDESNFYFCGRETIKVKNREFPYCKLHLLYAYQSSKDKKDENVVNKEEEVPNFLENKIKSA